MKRTIAVSAAFAAILIAGLAALTGCSSSSPSASNPNPSLLSTSTVLTASTTYPAPGVAFLLSATVTPSAATGNVTFYNGSTLLGTGTVSNGIATFAASFSTAGTYTVTADYTGSSTYSSSTSNNLTITVQNQTSGTLNPSTTAITPSATSVAANANVTLTATVSGSYGTPTGTVTFYDSATSIGTASLGSSGSASLSTSFTSVGTHYLVASYAGSSTYANSISSSGTVTVTGTTTTAPLGSGGAGSIYVVLNGPTGANSSILQYPANSNGTVAPTATLVPPAALQVNSVATDASGQIYVGGYTGSINEIIVYAAGATGSATPVRTIMESTSSSVSADSMAVDSSGLLYVAGYNITAGAAGVNVFSATASGTSTPVQSIVGSNTQLGADIFQITVDASKNIYVSTANAYYGTGSVVVFAAGATGNAAPIRNITAPNQIYGIAVDTSGNLYAVEDSETTVNGNPVATSSSLVEFAPGASGAATPVKTISGPATALTFGAGLRIDSAGNLYLVNATITSFTTEAATISILGFGPTATGNEPPAVNFTSTSWGENLGSQLALH